MDVKSFRPSLVHQITRLGYLKYAVERRDPVMRVVSGGYIMTEPDVWARLTLH